MVFLRLQAESDLKLNFIDENLHFILRKETSEINEFLDESWKRFNDDFDGRLE